MLGKLFGLTSTGPAGAPASGSPGQANWMSNLESVQEDVHTRNLLYPDAEALYQHHHDQTFPLSGTTSLPANTTGAFDYNGEVVLEARDVRVVILQDGIGSITPNLLFDSQPPPQSPVLRAERFSATNVQDARRLPTSPRKSSIGHTARPLIIQPDSPKLRHGAFDKRVPPAARGPGAFETDAQRLSREYSDELATFSSCIFANSDIMAYKGTSTKVHIVPTDSRGPDLSSSYIADGRGSIGRSSLRSSRLAQSFTSDAVSPLASVGQSHGSGAYPARVADKKKVLITRLFPVSLPSGDPDSTTPLAAPSDHMCDDAGGYPVPIADEMAVKRKKPQPKQKRTPMFAVALVINLPPAPCHLLSASTSKSPFRGPGSFNDQDSSPSSFSSSRRSGWAMIGSGFGGPESPDAGYRTDMEDRMDVITKHWDVIMRTLTHLQSVVAAKLFTLLRQVDLNSPDPYPMPMTMQVSRRPSQSGRRFDDGPLIKPAKTNAKLVALPANSLADDRHILREVDEARVRIVNGLRATRVVTGQGRWGIWREEARFLARWTAMTEGDFIFHLLTGFLATHTDWLQALGPEAYRRRYSQLNNQRLAGEDDLSLRARTVIISRDKMLARRIIFLLSAFLPTNKKFPALSAHRPGTSASVSGFSQSPPGPGIFGGKEEPLRKKMNRRTDPKRASHSRSGSTQSQTARSSGIPAQLAHLSMDHHHERRSSDAGSIRTSNLPIPGSDLFARKSSAATTATIMPEPSRPHFSTIQRQDTSLSLRPGSSGSVAADDLKRTLRRGESATQSSIMSAESRSQGSRWGSVIIGFWGAKRRDSTSAADNMQGPSDGNANNSQLPAKRRDSRVDKVSEMVKEVRIMEPVNVNSQDTDTATVREGSNPTTPRQASTDQGGVPRVSHEAEGEADDGSQSTSQPIDAPSAFDSPVKTTVNLDDGVIDVDVPFPDLISSLETAVSSPSSSGYLSTPGFMTAFEGFEHFARLGTEGDPPINVSGWVQHFHPDFALQAVASDDTTVLEKLKASMRLEPTPKIRACPQADSEGPGERWVDVGRALVVDTSDFSVKRIRYRRLVRTQPVPDNSGMFLSAPVGFQTSCPLAPLDLNQEHQIQEEFQEEVINTLDTALVEAVAKVIIQARQPPKETIDLSSISIIGLPDTGTNATGGESHSTQLAATQEPREVSRAECKTVILAALSEIALAEAREMAAASPEGRENAAQQKKGPLRQAVADWLRSVEHGG